MKTLPRPAPLLLGLALLFAGCQSSSSTAETPAAIAPATPADAPPPNKSVTPADAYDIRSLDQAPMPKFQARPQYPTEMRKKGIAGQVVVDFIVDTNGDVRNAYVLRSSRREFEAAAVAAVSKWKFQPGRKGGRAVETHMQVPIVFTLNEK